MSTARAYASPATAATAPISIAREGRQVLFICYHFPPDASVGAVRPAKFVKYLSRLGWYPYVVTVDDRYLTARDDTRLTEVARLPIVRTRVWPNLLQAALKVKRLFGRPAVPQQPAGSPAGAPRQTHTSAVKRYLNSLFELPDKQIGWLVPAAWRAYRLIKAEHVPVVVTSSPPWTVALIGLLLSYLLPIKLVTDLRDPWVTPYRRDRWFLALEHVASSRSALGDWILRWLEQKLVERSARVITTNERHARALRQAYPGLTDARISVIPNGFDADDFAALPEAADADRPFTIAYIGTFYLDRSPKQFLTALSELVREGGWSTGDFEVHLVGTVESTSDGPLPELILSAGLQDCIKVEGLLSHRESLLRMARADVLLLYQPQPYCSIPAKAFEYLATGRQILCLAREGATADLIEQTRAGVVVAPDDVAGIKAALTHFFEAFKARRRVPRPADLTRFDRARQAGELSVLLRELL